MTICGDGGHLLKRVEIMLAQEIYGADALNIGRYSEKNQAIILGVDSDAVYAGTFIAWCKTGYVPRKGSKGIKIRGYKGATLEKVDNDEPDGEPIARRHYRPLYVFTNTQVEKLTPKAEKATA